jgi:hypothetical protein
VYAELVIKGKSGIADQELFAHLDETYKLQRIDAGSFLLTVPVSELTKHSWFTLVRSDQSQMLLEIPALSQPKAAPGPPAAG